jgi:hypothetical protein
VKNKDLYKTVGKNVATTYDWEQYVDGAYTDNVAAPISGNSSNFGSTAAGVITEVYIDNTENYETVTVVYINQYLGQITNVKSDDDGEYVTVSVKNASVSNNKFYVEGFEKDDYVIVNLDKDSDNKTIIANVYEPETATGTVTAIERKGDRTDGYVELDDVKYTYNTKTYGDVEVSSTTSDPELNAQYLLYLDSNGYVVGFLAQEDVSSNYLYVKDNDVYLGDTQAKVVFADGTAGTIDVKKVVISGTETESASIATGALANYVYSYTINSKGAYTLTQVATWTTGTYGIPGKVSVDGSKDVENGSAYLGGLLADQKTVYVDVKDNVTYTGYENVPNYVDANVIMVDHDNDSIVDLAFIVDYVSKSNDDTVYFYVAKGTDYKTFKEGDARYTNRVVYIDGEKTNLIIESAEDISVIAETAGLYAVKAVDDKGYATKLTAYTTGTNNVVTIGTGSFWNGQTQSLTDASYTNTTSRWTYNSDTVFVLVDGTTVTAGSISDMTKAADVAVGQKYTTVDVVTNDKNLAKLVVMTTATKTAAGDGEGGLPAAANALGTSVDLDALEVSAVMKYGSTVAQQKAALNKALADKGVTIVSITGASSPYTLTANDGRAFTGTVTFKYTVTVNDTVVEYVAGSGSNTEIDMTKEKTTGNGYIYSVDNGANYTYAAYTTPVASASLSDNVIVKSGYVAVTGGSTTYAEYGKDYTVPAKGGNNGTGYSYTIDGGTAKFVAYGGTIPAADVTGDIALTKDKIQVTYTGFAENAKNKTIIAGYQATDIDVPEKDSSAGTGVLVSGITGTTYSAYDGSDLTATGSDVTIAAGYVSVTATKTTGVSAASANVTALPVSGGKVTITYTTDAVSTNAGTYVVKVNDGTSDLATFEFTAASGGDLGNATIDVNVGTVTSNVTLTIGCAIKT